MMCPTVWTGRVSYVTVSVFDLRMSLYHDMSNRLDIFFLNLLVNTFTGKLLVFIWMRCHYLRVLCWRITGIW